MFPVFRDIELENCVDLGSLPDNWEIRYTPSGRQYFVNHVNRTTQFTGISYYMYRYIILSTVKPVYSDHNCMVIIKLGMAFI